MFHDVERKPSGLLNLITLMPVFLEHIAPIMFIYLKQPIIESVVSTRIMQALAPRNTQRPYAVVCEVFAYDLRNLRVRWLMVHRGEVKDGPDSQPNIHAVSPCFDEALQDAAMLKIWSGQSGGPFTVRCIPSHSL
jgi:hypothetical protein